MADQTFTVNSGFYDAVNGDRTYSADDMNRPYKRLVSNGVFATPQGTPSTDLQVVSASNGMQIIVKPGEGIFADKWFENPAAINITVPDNTSTFPRIDSVLVQVDQTTSGRVGNIVYRTGTPSSNPAAPAINTVTNVTEYRVANIYVAAGANTINNDAITDLRGSSSCLWITALISQVDTSLLYAQWQAAYQNYYDQTTQEFDEYTAEQRTAWQAFLQSLTDDLTISTNVIMYTNYVKTAGTVSTVQIGIPSYNKDTDILQVYINGLLGFAEDEYEINSAGTAITLTNPLTAGTDVSFIVFKSIISADIQSAVSLMQALDARLSAFMADSGWIDFTLENGTTSFDSTTTPAVRCIGDRVYLRGAFKGITATNTVICTLPVAYRPEMNHQFTSAAVYNGLAVPVVIEVGSSGSVTLIAKSDTIDSDAMIPMATNFVLE